LVLLVVQQFAIRGLGEGDIETGARRASFSPPPHSVCWRCGFAVFTARG
jgi:hypothetical protein